jgi:hypothetical protein
MGVHMPVFGSGFTFFVLLASRGAVPGSPAALWLFTARDGAHATARCHRDNNPVSMTKLCAFHNRGVPNDMSRSGSEIEVPAPKACLASVE